VARSFSGDKEQLVPILEAGLKHQGFAFIDVISPCVTFNDHEGSTKSYAHTREHDHDVADVDLVPLRKEITVAPDAPPRHTVTLHDGSEVRFHRVEEGYDPTDRDAVYAYVRNHHRQGEIVTGLLYVDGDGADLHQVNKTVATPLAQLPYEQLTPGAAALAELQKRWR